MSYLHSCCLYMYRHVSNDLFHISDWLPTLLTAAGATSDMYPEIEDMDGVDQARNQHAFFFKGSKKGS